MCFPFAGPRPSWHAPREHRSTLPGRAQWRAWGARTAAGGGFGTPLFERLVGGAAPEPGALHHRQRAREDVAPICRNVATGVVVKTAAGLQAELVGGHVRADDRRRRVTRRVDRRRHLAARMVEDVDAADVDELDDAERREAQAETEARRLVDLFGARGTLLDHP